MVSLSSDLHKHCRRVLRRFDVFDSQENLRDVFAVAELAPYLDGLPEVQDKLQRVNRTMRYLLDRVPIGGEPIFLVFIRELINRTDETDSRHVDLELLLKELEGEIFLKNAVPSPQVKESSSHRARQPFKGKPIGSENQHIFDLVNKFHEKILKEQQAVASARAIFSSRKKDIYSDECRRLINPLSKLRKRIQDLDNFIVAHPFVFGRTRAPLIRVLNTIDGLLSESRSLLMDFCPKSLQSPMAQRQVIQRKLAEIAKYLSRMNGLINEIKKATVQDEGEIQRAETHATYPETAIQSVATAPVMPPMHGQ